MAAAAVVLSSQRPPHVGLVTLILIQTLQQSGAISADVKAQSGIRDRRRDQQSEIADHRGQARIRGNMAASQIMHSLSILDVLHALESDFKNGTYGYGRNDTGVNITFDDSTVVSVGNSISNSSLPVIAKQGGTLLEDIHYNDQNSTLVPSTAHNKDTAMDTVKSSTKNGTVLRNTAEILQSTTNNSTSSASLDAANDSTNNGTALTNTAVKSGTASADTGDKNSTVDTAAAGAAVLSRNKYLRSSHTYVIIMLSTLVAVALMFLVCSLFHKAEAHQKDAYDMHDEHVSSFLEDVE